MISFYKKIVNKKINNLVMFLALVEVFRARKFQLKWSGGKVPFEQLRSTTDKHNNSKSSELLTVENQVVHYVVRQESEEILGHCSFVSLVNGDLC